MAIDKTHLVNLGHLELAVEQVDTLFVRKEVDKGLSTNDFTDEQAAQLAELFETGGTPNIIEEVQVNGVALVPDVDKAVNISVPTNVSDLANDSEYAVLSDVEDMLDEKADKATTLAGYGIGDAYTKTEIDAKVSSVYRYKGKFETYAELTETVTDPDVGDMYHITKAGGTDENGTKIKAGDNVAWTGTGWDAHSGDVDLTTLMTIEDANTALAGKVDKVEGMGLSVENFTTALRDKLSAIVEGATKVEASATNGSIKVNDVDTVVYTLPETVLHTTHIAADADVLEMLSVVFA